MSNIKKLLDTMELIHYIEKFKNKVFVLVVNGKVYIRDIIPDIIILQSFNIKVILVFGKINEEEDTSDLILDISGMLKKHNLSPLSINGTEVFAKKDKNKKYGTVSGFDLDTINFALSKNKIPIIAPRGVDERGNYHKLNAKEISIELASAIDSNAIFYISELDMIEVNSRKKQFLRCDEVKSILNGDNKIDAKNKELLEYGLKAIDKGIKEISFIEGKTGMLFERVLSYDIAGTLISKVDDEKLRKAEIRDITSIYLLIKNEVEKQNILPISEETIEKEIENYLVFDIDNSPVAVGKLNYFDSGAEVSKIATFPRYQGGKKAVAICQALINKAKDENLDYIFGLTINDNMVKIFKTLGFKEVDREKLPEKWKENYDFSRPSRAFILKF